MQRKVSPQFVRSLYLMSVSNLLVMTICIFLAGSNNINIQFSALPAFAILATLLDVAMGYLSRAINNAALVFGLVNSLLSILLWVTARLLSRFAMKPAAVKSLKFAQAKNQNCELFKSFGIREQLFFSWCQTNQVPLFLDFLEPNINHKLEITSSSIPAQQAHPILRYKNRNTRISYHGHPHTA